MSIAMTAAVWKLHLEPTSKMVLLRLADMVNRNGDSAWPSIDWLARECCIHRRTVQRALRELEAAGLIETKEPQKGWRSVVYSLHPDRGVNLSPLEELAGVAHDRPRGGTVPPLGVTNTTHRGGVVPPKPYRTGKGNRKKKPGTPLTPRAGGNPVARAKAGSRRKRDVAAMRATQTIEERYLGKHLAIRGFPKGPGE